MRAFSALLAIDGIGGTGKNWAKMAAARTLLTPVYHGLRDGETHCLAARAP